MPRAATDPATAAGPSNPRTLKCSQCESTFTLQKHLQRHSATHDDLRPFLCPRCGRSFARLDSLQRHDKRQKNVNGEIRCPTWLAGRDRSPSSATQAAGAARPPLPQRDTEADLMDLLRSTAVAGTGLEHAGSVHSSMEDDPVQQTSSFGFSPATYDPHLAQTNDGGLPESMGDLFGGGNGTYFQPSNGGGYSAGGMDPWLDPLQFETMLAATLDNSDPSQWHTSIPAAGFDFFHLSSAAASPRPLPLLLSMDGSDVLLAHVSERCVQAVRGVLTWDSSQEGTTSWPVGANDVTRLASNLHVVEDWKQLDADEVLGPTFDFVDRCVAIFFRKFHHILPFIHAPTFRRSETPPLLLLSMVSVGAVFVGTESAITRGRVIYEQLHKVVIRCWHARFAGGTDETMAIIQTAVLGQTYGFMSGVAAHHLTSEAFHGTIVAWTQQNSLLDVQAKLPALSSSYLQTLSPPDLELAWHSWAKYESHQRTAAALIVHETMMRTGSVHPELVSSFDPSTIGPDSLFSAPSADKWLEQLVLLGNNLLASPSTFRNTVAACTLASPLRFSRVLAPTEASSIIYRVCSQLDAFDTDVHCTEALVQSLCLQGYVDVGLLYRFIGKSGFAAAAKARDALQEWCGTAEAGRALYYAAQVLQQVSSARVLGQSGVHIPRAIFHAVLTIAAYLACSPYISYSLASPSIDLGADVSWQHLPHSPGGSASRNVRFKLLLPGFVDGVSRRMDLIELLTAGARLVQQTTEWGVGTMFAKVLLILSELDESKVA